VFTMIASPDDLVNIPWFAVEYTDELSRPVILHIKEHQSESKQKDGQRLTGLTMCSAFAIVVCRTASAILAPGCSKNQATSLTVDGARSNQAQEPPGEKNGCCDDAQGSVLYFLYVPIPSTLCEKVVGGHICDACFARCGIKVERGCLSVLCCNVLGQGAFGRWATGH